MVASRLRGGTQAPTGGSRGAVGHPQHLGQHQSNAAEPPGVLVNTEVCSSSPSKSVPKPKVQLMSCLFSKALFDHVLLHIFVHIKTPQAALQGDSPPERAGTAQPAGQVCSPSGFPLFAMGPAQLFLKSKRENRMMNDSRRVVRGANKPKGF